MVLLELHLTTRSIRSAADILRYQRSLEYLLEAQGFRLFYLHANWGWTPRNQRVLQEMRNAGARHNVCCYEIGLVKPHAVQTNHGGLVPK